MASSHAQNTRSQCDTPINPEPFIAHIDVTDTLRSPSAITRVLGQLGAWFIRVWVRLWGRRMEKTDVPWLKGETGGEGPVGADFYERLAARDSLELHSNRAGSGLLESFERLAGPHFDPAQVHPEVRRFYEHTSDYELDVWSETKFPGRLMLWLIVMTVSRYMNQLNFPIFGLETSRGMTSEIVELCDEQGKAIHTGWFRRMRSEDRVIYTGFYMAERPPGCDSHCVKVVFPLPQGNATVLLRPLNQGDRLLLQSSGASFGDPGFYRLVEDGEARWRVLHMRSLREFFDVYVDEHQVLRCDHLVKFMGITMLRLHYRMSRAR